MFRVRRYKSVVLVFILAGMLIGCDNSGNIEIPLTPNPSLFHFIDGDCIAPCWFGIVPGTSDQATASQSVNRLGHKGTIVRGTSSLEINKKKTTYEIYFYQLVRGDNIGLALRNDIVVRLQIFLGVNDRPTLGEIVDVFGEPDKICVMDKTIPDASPDYETSLVYENRGIWVSSNVVPRRTANGPVIYPEMKINQVTFFDPGDDLDLVMVQLSEPRHVLNRLIDCLEKWEGFGIYKIEYGW